MSLGRASTGGVFAMTVTTRSTAVKPLVASSSFVPSGDNDRAYPSVYVNVPETGGAVRLTVLRVEAPTGRLELQPWPSIVQPAGTGPIRPSVADAAPSTGTVAESRWRVTVWPASTCRRPLQRSSNPTLTLVVELTKTGPTDRLAWVPPVTVSASPAIVSASARPPTTTAAAIARATERRTARDDIDTP